MNITRSIDVEDVIRAALAPHMAAYCRPLPAAFSLPSVLVTQVGGTDEEGAIDIVDVVLDARAKTSAEANETLRNAVAIMRQAAKEQTTAIRHLEVNSSGSWGADPVRPDLAMYSARLRVWAHLEQITI